MAERLYKAMVRAQLLIVPLLFFSCNRADTPDSIIYADTTVSMVSYNHTMVHAGNGLKRFKMSAPEIRRYEYASEPYTVYPKGVKILCYSDTSSMLVVADLTADYAVLWENLETWEARGHIVGNNYSDNKHFETDILFWDQNDGLIYNDHYTKVFDAGNWWVGYGFQTDDMFSRWRFNRSRGQMTVKNENPQPLDSVAQDSLATANGEANVVNQEKNDDKNKTTKTQKSKFLW